MRKIQSKQELTVEVYSGPSPNNSSSSNVVIDSAGTMVRFNEVERQGFRWLAALQAEVRLVDAKVEPVWMADAKRRVLEALTNEFGQEPGFDTVGSPRYQVLERVAQAGSVAGVVQAVPLH